MARRHWRVTCGKGANSKPLPEQSFIPHKPEPLGAELKAAADGITGIFTRLMYNLDKYNRNATNNDYVRDYEPAVAMVLQMLKPWFQPEPPQSGTCWFGCAGSMRSEAGIASSLDCVRTWGAQRAGTGGLCKAAGIRARDVFVHVMRYSCRWRRCRWRRYDGAVR